MSVYLVTKKLDITTGEALIVVLNSKDADVAGIRPGDLLSVRHGLQKINVTADITTELVKEGEIGIFKDVFDEISVDNGDVVRVDFLGRSPAVKAIVKKLLRNELGEEDIKAIVQGIVDHHLGTIETTYFAACGFNPGFSEKELYYLTKAIAETGDTINWKETLGVDKVVDKHCIGGIPGKGVTPIVVSIIASLGLIIPDAPSRAITAPTGTADLMEVFCPVTFTRDEVVQLVKKIGACIVWGGGLDIAPADEELIRIERPLGIELYDKFIVSIMAKKVAMGITHMVLDLPTGVDTKVEHPNDIPVIKQKFFALADQFGMVIDILERHPLSPDGRGVGPALEARDVMLVLEQDQERYLPLESLAVKLSGRLLEIVGYSKEGKGESTARKQLESGKALEMFKKIIDNQGGNPGVTHDSIPLGDVIYVVYSEKAGEVKDIQNSVVREIAGILGCPHNKKAGIYFYKQVNEEVKKGEKLLKLYSTNTDRLEIAKEVLKEQEVVIIK